MITIKCERCGVESQYESLSVRSNDGGESLDRLQVEDFEVDPIKIYTLCPECRDAWITRQVRANQAAQTARKKYCDAHPFLPVE